MSHLKPLRMIAKRGGRGIREGKKKGSYQEGEEKELVKKKKRGGEERV